MIVNICNSYKTDDEVYKMLLEHKKNYKPKIVDYKYKLYFIERDLKEGEIIIQSFDTYTLVCNYNLYALVKNEILKCLIAY